MNPLQATVRLHEALGSRSRNLWFRALGVRINGYVWLRRVSIPRSWSDVTLESCSLDDGVVLLCSGPAKRNKIVIRSGAYVNRFTMFDAHKQIDVGPGCMIGPYCYLTDANHGMASGLQVAHQPMTSKPVIIEEGVWLGAGVMVLSGVTIGKHAIVGAGAVVTKDVPPNSTVVGIPAREIRRRPASPP